MRVLVTGGTGYLGRAVVRALAAHGHEPVVFARSASSSGLRAAAIDGDIRDRAAVDRAVRACEAVCHMAALVTIWRRRREDFDDVNVGGLRNVIEAVSAAGIGKLVYTSSFLALPPAGRTVPIAANDYQRTKVVADRLAAEAAAAGVPIVRVYPGVVYGPGTMTEGNLVGRLIADHVRGKLPGLVGPENRWSYAYVDDVADAHLSALERAAPGSQYIAGGENATQRRLFEIVREITGRAVPRRIPFLVATTIATIEEWRARATGALPMITRGAVEIFRHNWSLDSSAAVTALGYRITPLTSGVRHTIAALEAGARPS
jgi:NAD+-dependent farnesol dehydrogenase